MRLKPAIFIAIFLVLAQDHPRADALGCDGLGASSDVLGFLGGLVGDAPGFTALTTLASAIFSAIEGECDQTAYIKHLIADSINKNNAESAKGYLAGVANTVSIDTLTSSNAKNALENGDIEKERDNLARRRYEFFDKRGVDPIMWETFVGYASLELALTEVLIQHWKGQKRHTNKKFEEEAHYAKALKYYLKKGAEYYFLEPLKGFKKGEETGDSRLPIELKRYANRVLRTVVVGWIKLIRTNREVQTRLGLFAFGVSDVPEDYDYEDDDDWWGEHLLLERHYLPLPISDNDWVTLRCHHFYLGCDSLSLGPGSGYEVEGEDSWLSCWGSVDDEDYCEWRDCPGDAGGQGKNKCRGERFQIQTTHHGIIKYSDDVAFKYFNLKKDDERDKGHYWLSYGHGKNSANPAKYLYTEKCPGETFDEGDIKRCAMERFRIIRDINTEYYPKDLIRDMEKEVRSGDDIYLEMPNVQKKCTYAKPKYLQCFIVKEWKQ